MTVERITVTAARLPMGRPFVHATKRRTTTASVLVTVEAGGQRGWGEGAPRPYVTGEDVDGTADALSRLTPADVDGLLDLADFDRAVTALAGLDLVAVTGGPAAAAALELALFDLVCRLHGRTGFEALRRVPWVRPLLRDTPEPVAASLVLDLSTDAPADTSVRHVKVKATADADDCVRRVAAVRDRFPSTTTISVDVNGVWDGPAAVRTAARLRDLGVAWVEEPVKARDWAALRDIRTGAGMPVMLDESCTDLADLDAAVAAGAVDLVNVRVSKAGGLFPALALLTAAGRHGAGAQLGVHVGEIGPLWAAARLIACAVRPLSTVEAGRHDEWFPDPLTEPPFLITDPGRTVAPLPGPGLGVTPSDFLHKNTPTSDQGPTTESTGGSA